MKDPDLIPDLLIITTGDFAANIHVGRLPDLTRAQYRLILKLLFLEPFDNRRAIELLPEMLGAQIEVAQNEWRQAGQAYADGWHYVENKHSRKPKDMEILKENKRLTKAVKRAKARLDTFKILLNIFEQEKEKYNI